MNNFIVDVITPYVNVCNLESIVGDFTKSPSLKIMEYVCRVCYNSYDKITDKSFFNILSSAAKRGHRSIFEFSNLEYRIKTDISQKTSDSLKSIIFNNKYLKINEQQIESNNVIITGSLRAFIELLEYNVGKSVNCISILNDIFSKLNILFDIVLKNWITYQDMLSFYKIDNLYSTDLKDITLNINNRYDKNRKILVELITDKGLHNELVRHRDASHMAASQRYIRSNDKKNMLKICIDSEQYKDAEYVDTIKKFAELSLCYYDKLLITKSPQIARTVLPVGAAMKSFIYCNMTEWEHIIRLRSAKDALPMAQEVVKEIMQQFINKRIY